MGRRPVAAGRTDRPKSVPKLTPVPPQPGGRAGDDGHVAARRGSSPRQPVHAGRVLPTETPIGYAFLALGACFSCPSPRRSRRAGVPVGATAARRSHSHTGGSCIKQPSLWAVLMALVPEANGAVSSLEIWRGPYPNTREPTSMRPATSSSAMTPSLPLAQGIYRLMTSPRCSGSGGPSASRPSR